MGDKQAVSYSPYNQEDGAHGVFTVSALTDEIKRTLEDRFEFLWVEGELSNVRVPQSGHYYMVLKDARAQIRAVMFRNQARLLKFVPEDGMKVLCNGRIGIYAPRGEYQIILDYIEPLGVGSLAVAFEQLKQRLAAKGLFDEATKKTLPFLPTSVAVITSPTGAAIRDFLRVIHRRFANIEIIVVPVKVQGEEAAGEMVQALEVVNRELDVDVIVLTRGGGSLEDLWAFNDEALAYAIRASRIPVVSAVGHEIDVTISDLAADLRAPTPSSAAEMLVREKESLLNRLRELQGRMQRDIGTRLSTDRQRLAYLTRGLGEPHRDLEEAWLRFDDLTGRLGRSMIALVAANRVRLEGEYRALRRSSPEESCRSLRKGLDFHRRSLHVSVQRRLAEHQRALGLLEEKARALSPLSVLKRGYSITRKLPEKRVLRTVSGLGVQDRVDVILAEGSMECRIEKLKREGSF